jgi:hypothetical protein
LEKTCKKKNILQKISAEERAVFFDKIVPWTFFPSRMVKQFISKELDPHPVTTFGFFCGKKWRSRGKIYEVLEKQGIEIIASSQEIRAGRPLKDDEYIEKMRNSKFGIVLRGRAAHLTQAKNRREIDYMILRKPILMNYEPYYYNPLIPGKHFILIDEETDLKSIESMYNINEIAENGYQWYLNNASPEGCVNVFLQIIKERLGE